ncbi:hypothetical protein [Kibdelosporangium phytohabitans]|uniref:Uncharacterized protein n=1 Tax=Kibdelosporangium phytohabitans TaxID=860235 RepID=A0A0N9HSZ7_9PSEU|nr:hypothetical protein [Kibdelosporangium phytohabitans]ALG08067.1 hypothetical protein AOZ06_15110 [Kibdelosporangium phytohabitans]MBE1470960.1 hypothetical protein [Kibdelosporangium phytohabitans]
MLPRFRSLRSELSLHKSLVSRYAKFIDELHPMYQVLSWEQIAYIENAQGDTREVVTFRARVLRSDLQLIRLVFGCGWDQPHRFRRRVRIAVRNLHVGNMLGTSMQVTHSYLCDGKHDVIIHMATPPKVGSEVRFLVVMDWPRKCAPLMTKAVSDDFAFKFIQQNVSYVSYRVVLPHGCDAYDEPIGFDGYEETFKNQQLITTDGRRIYFFEAFDLPILHRAGIRLELKGKDTHALRALAASISSLTR